jgi:hypothetical protein
MQFLTILKPKRSRNYVRGIRGGRGLYFDDFEYELSDDPLTEGITAQFGPELGRCFPRDLWPEVTIGARNGWEWAHQFGVRFCSVRFTLLFAKYHDVDTTSQAVQLRIADCIAKAVPELSEPVWALCDEWLTSDVVALARGIHAKRALDGLPALTDALLEAGCDDPLAIEHLTTCPDHGPMCWVVEMICAQAAARDGEAR